MLDGPQRWATFTNMGKFTHLAYHGKTDTRVSQMKLKQKSLTGRPQDKRLNTSYSSLLQKRNLKEFPMDYSKEESMKAAQGQRIFRQQFQKRMNQAKTDSENLRQYSRRMFENVVQTNNDNNIIKHEKVFENGHRYSTRLTMPSHNGPTPEGSLLYNHRGKILNTLRLRHKSEISTAYNHERAKSIPPVIQRTLCQSNCDFRVMPTPTPNQVNDRSLSSASDYKLVPLNGAFSDYSSTLDLNLNSEHSDSVFVDDILETPRTISQVSTDCTTYRNRFVTPAEVRFYSLECDTSSESSAETKTEVTIEKPPEEPKQESEPEPVSHQEKSKPKSAGRQKSGPRPKSGVRPKSGARAKSVGRTKSGKKKFDAKETEPPLPPPQPEPTPVTVTLQPKIRKPLKGPHCWVDDATVSSIHDQAYDQRLSYSELQLDDERVSWNSKTSQGVKQQTANTPVHSVTKKVEQTALSVKDIVQNTEEILERNYVRKQNQAVIKIKEVEENFLPSFLCPSSEKKSREAAVYDWLSNTNFQCGLACVPLY